MMKELFDRAKMFATVKECFATTKLKLRNIVALGFPRQRILLNAAKRFSTAEVEARYGEEKRLWKGHPRVRHNEKAFIEPKVGELEQQTSIFDPIIGPFSKAYKQML